MFNVMVIANAKSKLENITQRNTAFHSFERYPASKNIDTMQVT